MLLLTDTQAAFRYICHNGVSTVLHKLGWCLPGNEEV